MFVLIHGGALAGLVVPYFIQYANNDGVTQDRFGGWFGAKAGVALASVNTVFLAVDLVCIALLAQLYIFHVRLRHQGITVSAKIFGETSISLFQCA